MADLGKSNEIVIIRIYEAPVKAVWTGSFDKLEEYLMTAAR